jgi:hypothetical protein
MQFVVISVVTKSAFLEHEELLPWQSSSRPTRRGGMNGKGKRSFRFIDNPVRRLARFVELNLNRTEQT